MVGLATSSDRPLYEVENVLPPELINELRFIHRTTAVAGYRPHYFSTTLACAPLWALPALLRARRIVRDIAEKCFGLEFELTSETTATASWVTGAELPTHCDNEKEYLAHRDVSAVVWLNDNSEFSGGQFFYETDSKHEVTPEQGKGVFFRADLPHGVEKITRGRRLGLLFWFTSTGGAEASEDRKLLERGFPPFWSLTPLQRLFGFGPQVHFPIEQLAESLEVSSDQLQNRVVCSQV